MLSLTQQTVSVLTMLFVVLQQIHAVFKLQTFIQFLELGIE